MSRPPRAPSFSYRGRYRYFLTFCCRNRDKVFVTPERVDTVMSQIRSTARHEEFAILGYCVMPDHVHLLVEGRTDSSDLSRFAKMAKQRSGAAFTMIEQGPLWQEGYFDRILREGDDVRGVLRYLLENPIRAGIVERVEDYPHLGSDTWTTEEIVDGLQT